MRIQWSSFCRTYALLIVAMSVGLFFRVIALEQVPPSLSIDEVSIGWNAYSLSQTGRDEYGTQFPVLLRAYDDYRPALYVYTVIPFISFFGLTATAVRLPSVILSLLTIGATFLLVRLIQPKNLVFRLKTVVIDPASVAAFLLALSPWHMYISRLGHEANLGLSAGIFGVLFFFLFLRHKHSWYLIGSGLSFVIALYGYQSQKIIVPLLLFSLGLLFMKELWRHKVAVIGVLLMCTVLCIPLIRATASPQGLIRLQGTSAFTEGHPLYEARRKAFVEAKEQGSFVKQVVSHPRLTTAIVFIQQYMTHFSPRWLFTGSSEEAHKVPYMGLLFPWELPFILLGIYLVGKKLDRRFTIFLYIWFLTSPIPAAIATQVPHAMRSYTFLPLWQLFGGMGIVSTLVYLKKTLVPTIIGLSVLSICSGVVLYDRYMHVFPTMQSQSFSYATRDAIQYVLTQEHLYDRVVFNTILGTPQYPSYMFYLFYSQYDPQIYLHAGGTQSGSFTASHAFQKYMFKPIHPGEEMPQILYVDTYQDKGKAVRVHYIGRYLDGTPGVMVYSL